MADRKPLGPLVDQLGVTGDIRPNDQVTECLVLCKVIDCETGDVSLGRYVSDGLDWLSEGGLLEAARLVCYQGAQLEQRVSDDD